MADLPPGLTGVSGELTELGMVVEDAANYLAMRGWLDPDAEEYPPEVLAELAEMAREPRCGALCLTTQAGWIHPSSLADHFLASRQEEWERSLPVWACTCGRAFKVLPGDGGGPGETFFDLGDGGLLGELIGCIRRNTKEQVKHSDACPRCKRSFADTIADQLNPQQVLF